MAVSWRLLAQLVQDRGTPDANADSLRASLIGLLVNVLCCRGDEDSVRTQFGQADGSSGNDSSAVVQFAQTLESLLGEQHEALWGAALRAM